MHLVQILLPVFDNAGRRFHNDLLEEVRRELTETFGGVTAYIRAPAAGAWQRDDGFVDRDQMVMVEVMIDELDVAWWDRYRGRLESRFQQDEIVIRALGARRL